jgi:hypothetical protein
MIQGFLVISLDCYSQIHRAMPTPGQLELYQQLCMTAKGWWVNLVAHAEWCSGWMMDAAWHCHVYLLGTPWTRSDKVWQQEAQSCVLKLERSNFVTLICHITSARKLHLLLGCKNRIYTELQQPSESSYLISTHRRSHLCKSYYT